MHIVKIVALLVLTGAPGSLQAQTTDTVRVTHSCMSQVNCRTDRGTVSSATRDRVVLQTGDGILEIPRQNVVKVELRQGHYSKSGTGALIGAILVGGAGAVAFSNLCDLGDGGCQSGSQRAGGAAVGLVVGGAVGAGLGAIVGMLVKRDRWVEVPLGSVPVAVRHFERGGFGLGVALAF